MNKVCSITCQKKKIEKVSKKAHSPSGVRMEVGLASVVPGTQMGWALSWQ